MSSSIYLLQSDNSRLTLNRRFVCGRAGLLLPKRQKIQCALSALLCGLLLAVVDRHSGFQRWCQPCPTSIYVLWTFLDRSQRREKDEADVVSQ